MNFWTVQGQPRVARWRSRLRQVSPLTGLPPLLIVQVKPGMRTLGLYNELHVLGEAQNHTGPQFPRLQNAGLGEWGPAGLIHWSLDRCGRGPDCPPSSSRSARFFSVKDLAADVPRDPCHGFLSLCLSSHL